MRLQMNDFLQNYSKAIFAMMITVCLVRVDEFFLIANHSFLQHTYWLEIAGWLYDCWACLIYGVLFLAPCFLLYWVFKRFAFALFHTLNVILLITYLGLIVIFSERNTPFDHEMFTRSFRESWLTTRQMMTSGIGFYIPFIVYVLIYFITYFGFLKRLVVGRKTLVSLLAVSIIALAVITYANPPEKWFSKTTAYYFTCNKFSFWVADTYRYFHTRDLYDAAQLSEAELAAAIGFYQQHQPFTFTSQEYPLLHKNEDKDVLGNFFNLPPTPPNIVLIVVEGLSKDFSGKNAYAGSFTPFLDSLAEKSLAWDNFLSTAPGTFAAHPAISGSLPYGKRGFSLINVMPDHLSLIKILRSNGYHAKFLIGFNPDFDNMGGYMRLQGTDMILSKYPSKYKEMGVGEEGWSMGYPDDALFNRSFEVMDSLKQTPYLNIYHTATTHMPYLFAQKATYEKSFDKKIKTMAVSPAIKKTLQESKKVLVTYMFSDDCLKDFFRKYAKRPEYAHTIFFITGDHHIGSFPSTGAIDDYHVPLIVYSPMLKTAKRFLSVNSHNNLAPTITALILNNYPLPNKPQQVHWLAPVMDTAAEFRNTQSMPFMAWSREMTDYIYKDYILSGTQLYKLTPSLLQEKVVNDSLRDHMTRLLNNFKIINSYVCDNNKVFPAKQAAIPGERKLLFSLSRPELQNIFTKDSDTTLMPAFAVPLAYKYLYVEVAAKINLLTPGLDDQPAFRFGIVDSIKSGRNFIYWTNHNIVQIAKGAYEENKWNDVSTNDMFTLSEYRQVKHLFFDLSFYTQVTPLRVQMKNLQMNIYGIK
jgi:phosphoglycerol transferase MdoB-like AlkP superfamily enzyme